MSVRPMSQYPKNFIQPIVRKQDQEQLKKTNEYEKLKVIPFRAAPNSQHSSPLYDPLIEKFINMIMEMGKRELARDLLQKTFEKIKRIQLERYHNADEEEKKTIELQPRVILERAIENCRPLMRLVGVKRGGTTYQVPSPITEKRSLFYSMKWLLDAANDKHRTIHFPEKMAFELLDAAYNTGRVVKRKQDLHRQCEANRAYAHYRWR